MVVVNWLLWLFDGSVACGCLFFVCVFVSFVFCVCVVVFFIGVVCCLLYASVHLFVLCVIDVACCACSSFTSLLVGVCCLLFVVIDCWLLLYVVDVCRLLLLLAAGDEVTADAIVGVRCCALLCVVVCWYGVVV